MFYKLLIKILIFIKNNLPLNKTNNHKYLNKNQVTTLNIVMNSLKNRGYQPDNIFDVGCFQGLWTKEILNIYNDSNFFLYDANDENDFHLNKLKQKHKNIFYKFKLFADDTNEYKFYKMFSGSSIFPENTLEPRDEKILKSSLLSEEIKDNIRNTNNNLIKIDAQGSEIKILNGLGNNIKYFEVVILEVSVHEYNKGAPLFNEVSTFMNKQDYTLYDIYDLKRLGNEKSFLIQFDCIFVRNNSQLLKVKF